MVNAKLAAYTQYWTILAILTLIITSYVFYFAYIWVSDQFPEFTSYQTAGMLFLTPNFYLAIFGCMGIVLAFDLLILFFRAEIKRDLLETIKLGVKRGLDRSETFFRDLFEKKQTLNETLDITKQKIEKKDNEFKEKKENSFHFKKIGFDLEQT